MKMSYKAVLGSIVISTTCCFAQIVEAPSSGWHLLGSKEDFTIGDLAPYECVETAWAYEDKTWHDMKTNVSHTVRDGMGYWLKTNKNCILEIGNNGVTEDAPPPPAW